MTAHGTLLVRLVFLGCGLVLTGSPARAEGLLLPDRQGDEWPSEPAEFFTFLRTLGEACPTPRPAAGPVLPSLSSLLGGVELIGGLPAAVADQPEKSPRPPQKVSNNSQGWWGALTANVVLQDNGVVPAGDQTLRQGSWKTDQAWRCEVAGPFSAFGQLGANSTEVAQTDMQVNARTGLACKVPVAGLAEIVVRGGPGVSWTDPLRPERTLVNSDWLFEVQARCPLVFGAGLEYQASAVPALTPQMQDQLNQDLRVAFPVGSNGKVRVGAKHKWASTSTPQPWTDGMQLYLGLELAR
jgi:hypothetical protein